MLESWYRAFPPRLLQTACPASAAGEPRWPVWRRWLRSWRSCWRGRATAASTGMTGRSGSSTASAVRLGPLPHSLSRVGSRRIRAAVVDRPAVAHRGDRPGDPAAGYGRRDLCLHGAQRRGTGHPLGGSLGTAWCDAGCAHGQLGGPAGDGKRQRDGVELDCLMYRGRQVDPAFSRTYAFCFRSERLAAKESF